MTQQETLVAIISAFVGSGLVGTLIGYLVYRKRTKAETKRTNAEAEAKLAEAKSLEADVQVKLAEAKSLEAEAASKLSDAVSDIVSGFQNLIAKSEERCKQEIAVYKGKVEKLESYYEELKQDNTLLKKNYAQLKKVYDELKDDYAGLLAWSKAVSQDLKRRGIPYPEPPEKVQTVIPKNGEKEMGYVL